MNAKWILVLFVGLYMALHISNAEVYDELLRQDSEFENRQLQKRSESLNLLAFLNVSFILLRYHIIACERRKKKLFNGTLKVKLLSMAS